MASVESQRLFRCDHCGRSVSICRSCDRGQRYRGRDCSRQARLQAHREANRRYQATTRGRELHRRRQTLSRVRQRAEEARVTDQGASRRPTAARAPQAPPPRGFCSVCNGGPVNFYRLDALGGGRRARPLRRRRVASAILLLAAWSLPHENATQRMDAGRPLWEDESAWQHAEKF